MPFDPILALLAWPAAAALLAWPAAAALLDRAASRLAARRHPGTRPA